MTGGSICSDQSTSRYAASHQIKETHHVVLAALGINGDIFIGPNYLHKAVELTVLVILHILGGKDIIF